MATQRHRKTLCIIVLALVCASLNAYRQRVVPALWGLHVHDEAQALSAATVDGLERRLSAYKDSTSNQLAILIIPSLDGDVLEQYSLRVAESWQLGDADKDNGALLLIVVDDRKMRIEAGKGLEGVLTDAVCSRIIRNEIAPAFRQAHFDEGVTAGINAMIGAIGGEYTAEDSDNDGNADLNVTARILIGLFIFTILGLFAFIGIISPGCAGWFLYVFLIPFYALFPMVVVGTDSGLGILITYLVAFPVLKLVLGRTAWGKGVAKKLSSRSQTSGGGSWSAGSGWSGGGGGWSSGGGGFSGGGGSFGGGGSSGSW